MQFANSVVIVLTFIAFAAPCLPRTIHVPAQQPTIQAGIFAADTGDEVIVADGVYSGSGNRDIDLMGKAITVRSANGSLTCIIDCGGAAAPGHRGFFIDSGETATTVIEGFTITHGYITAAVHGGGVRIIDSSPTIRDCRFVANRAKYGGGVYVSGGSATFRTCQFLSNIATEYIVPQGAGLFVTGANLALTDCSVIGNQCVPMDPPGPGLPSFPDGFGIHSLMSDLTLINCVLAWQGAEVNGIGSAIRFWTPDEDPVPRTLSMLNCTVSYNEGIAAILVGSVGVGGPSAPVTFNMHNSIVWGNFPYIGTGEFYQIRATSGMIDMVAHSDIEDGYPGEGNIDADPQFVDVLGVDGLGGTGDEDLRLLSGSACIDAGDNRAVPPEIITDLGGDPRIADGDGNGKTIVDMGVYEFQPPLDPADLDEDGDVDGFDLAQLLGQWTGAASYAPCPPHAPADLNVDCKVNGTDLALVLGAWG